MRVLQSLLFAVFISVSVCALAGVLQNAGQIQVDPTVVEHPERVADNTAANLVRYDLRSAIRRAHLEEGNSPVRAHIVLDEFSLESRARRLIDLGSGRSVCTVSGTLVFSGMGGKELARIPFRVHGSVVPVQGDSTGAQNRQAISDLEQRFLEEIEKLK